MAKKYTPCLNEACFFTNCNKSLCHVHHIFFGSDRKKSEKYGMKVYLHPRYHTEFPHGVHRNRANDVRLKLYGMQKFEEMYPELEFRDIFNTAFLKDVTID